MLLYNSAEYISRDAQNNIKKTHWPWCQSELVHKTVIKCFCFSPSCLVSYHLNCSYNNTFYRNSWQITRPLTLTLCKKNKEGGEDCLHRWLLSLCKSNYGQFLQTCEMNLQVCRIVYTQLNAFYS